MSDKRRWPLIGAGVPLGLFLLLVAAWGIDSVVSADQVVRNVLVGTTNLGGLSEADVVNAGADLTTRLSTQPFEIVVGDTSISTNPVAVGVGIDGERLAADALAARRGGFILARPFHWVGTFFSDEIVEAHYRYNPEPAESVTTELINPALNKPSDPTLTLTNNELTVIPGTDGSIVEGGVLAAAVPTSMQAGSPFVATLATIPLRPDLETSALEVVASEANTATADPVLIKVLDTQAVLEGTQIRQWISLDFSSGSPDWTIDNNMAVATLLPLFPLLGSEDQQATFNVIEGLPVIIPAAESVVCCDDQTAVLLKAGLLADEPVLENDEDAEDTETEATETDETEDSEAALPERSIRLEPDLTGGVEGVVELEALGIIEEVSTFTTNHDCCENRVVNIQLMAEIVQGYIIRPGETFDLNEIVGRRTSSAGFKPAGAIANGILEAQVGGGVSQFTTTILNAAFFGGLDIVEYQSHSLYFSRYPKGREATISFPKPDFIIRNPTEYGILVWPTWTPNSITVTFYSTKNVEVFCVARDGSLVSGPSECDKTITSSSQGQCTRWTTKRERVFANGDVQNDSVFAVYRPGKGLDCAGNSTVPTTTDPDATTTTEGGDGETTTTVGGGDTTTTTGGDTTTTTAVPPSTESTTTTTTAAPPSSTDP